MPLPKVAIVGRPNVGKSSIFNWLAGRLIAVVDPTPGVTRDRVVYLMHDDDRYFELIDTGGMGIEDADDLTDDIERQITIAIDEADLIVYVVDAQTSVVPLDEHVAARLWKIDKRKLLVVNKCDSEKLEAEAPAFFGLIDAPHVMTSVKGKRNRDGLLKAVIDNLPEEQDAEEAEGEFLAADPELKLAIVGRRNVGKSTFINSLAEEERVIVSEVAGTTRDSIDIRFDVDGRSLVAIDTPGVRRKKSIANDIEFYGLVRAQKSIRRADVVFMFFDAHDTISKVDKQLVEEIQDHHKPCVFVINKWDLGRDEGMTTEKWNEYLTHNFASMRHVPLAFITANDSKNIRQLVNLAQTIFKQAHIRVGTGELNRIVSAAVKSHPVPYRKNRRPKIFYATQVSTAPPTIVFKCNDPKLIDESWKRYLLGVLREKLPFKEVPLRVHFRSRARREEYEPEFEASSPDR
jgi:GTP-binding protein